MRHDQQTAFPIISTPVEGTFAKSAKAAEGHETMPHSPLKEGCAEHCLHSAMAEYHEKKAKEHGAAGGDAHTSAMNSHNYAAAMHDSVKKRGSHHRESPASHTVTHHAMEATKHAMESSDRANAGGSAQHEPSRRQSTRDRGEHGW